MKVAYLRVSSSSQSLIIQREAVSKLNIQKIFEEKVSGTSTQGRDKLKECLDFVREGDELVITRIDRLARSVLDLQLIVKELNDKVYLSLLMHSLLIVIGDQFLSIFINITYNEDI